MATGLDFSIPIPILTAACLAQGVTISQDSLSSCVGRISLYMASISSLLHLLLADKPRYQGLILLIYSAVSRVRGHSDILLWVTQFIWWATPALKLRVQVVHFISHRMQLFPESDLVEVSLLHANPHLTHEANKDQFTHTHHAFSLHRFHSIPNKDDNMI